MPSILQGQGPSLSTFLKTLKQSDNIEASIELFISLLKRRQIRNSRPCALATAHLLLRVVAVERLRGDDGAQKLIERIRAVGRKLVAAQPREMAVGNIVRRVLGVVREVVERDDDVGGSESGGGGGGGGYGSPSATGTQTPMESSVPALDAIVDGSGRRPQLASSTSYAGQGPQSSSLLSFLEHPLGRSPAGTPPPTTGTQSPNLPRSSDPKDKIDIKAEVIDGIKELLDELEVVDTQIAESALDHIHSNEIILTHTSSQTVQKFLMTAARKRKFTVIHAEAYPNDHEATHATIVHGGKRAAGDSDDDSGATDERWKPLTALGVTVVLVPDSAVFALMSRINKVILAPHAVLANGSLLAGAGASTIAHAARAHRVPVVVLSGVYKLSPVFPFDTDSLIEYGDPGKVVPFEQGDFMDRVEVSNPVYDWVEAELVDLYITNLGGCAPSFLYRIVADHYSAEDVELTGDGTRTGTGMGRAVAV